MTYRFFKYYQEFLRRRPYLVQAIQTGGLMATGDVISQVIIEKTYWRDTDIQRTLKFGSIGFFIGGPALRTWYGVLNKYVGSQGKIVTIKKVFLDQFLFAPSFLCILLISVAALQRKTWDIIKVDLKSNYFDVLTTNYYIWPWVQILNFYYVPLHYQVLVVQIVALFWNTYLSWKTNKQIALKNL
uniref:Mitochondrial inner membrane protein Mpv17 n=1 Tax=Bombyx mori TaxID=7091 RepID=A0A8R2AIU3_BOMMO|nr:protein Mpv17 [Bombyx mori]